MDLTIPPMQHTLNQKLNLQESSNASGKKRQMAYKSIWIYKAAC